MSTVKGGYFMLRIIMTGGGTAGHINPALLIAKYFKERQLDSEILFVGATGGMEGELVRREGFGIKFVDAKGFPRKLSGDMFTAVKKMFVSYSQSKEILKDFAPDAVIGTGGYVCGMLLFAAHNMGIKTYVHEQNVIPGLTVKYLSKIVNATFISFAGTTKYIQKRVILTGNPISENLLNFKKEECREKLELDGRPVILIYGGSLGADRINEVVCDYIKNCAPEKKYQIIFGTGKRNYDGVMNILGKPPSGVRVTDYIYNMDECMTACDLVISRAGAMTVSEISAVGRSAILIPSPNVAHNHQENNARALEAAGGAAVIPESELNYEVLDKKIDEMLSDNARIAEMSQNSKSIGRTNALEIIYKTVRS